MRRSTVLLLAGFVVVTISLGALLAAQTSSSSAAAPAANASFKTAWGDPDLQGVWENSTITPLERPRQFGDKAFLTEEEAKALDAEAAERYDRRPEDTKADVDAAYNQAWWDRGGTVASRRTSLIVDPADGRLPALTPDGQARLSRIGEVLSRPSHGPEDRNLAERCVTRGAPKLPGGYNNNFLIVQTPDHVAILQEMVHETRVIPLDGRPHLPATMAQWLGDSRGHWDGDTLVVETTNYHPLSAFNSYYCCRSAGAHLKIVERYRRVDAETIDMQFTVEDATTFVRPFTVDLPMKRAQGPILEYACHEGNYGMEGILSGARAQEKAEASRPRSPRVPMTP